MILDRLEEKLIEALIELKKLKVTLEVIYRSLSDAGAYSLLYPSDEAFYRIEESINVMLDKIRRLRDREIHGKKA